MIRLLRVCSIAVLAVAATLFAFATVREQLSQDKTLPTITAESEAIEVPCEYTDSQLLAGVTASDEKDGDLTDQILVGNFTSFIDPGVCDLSYVVFDSAGHMATVDRRVHFTDYHSPRFALSKSLVFAEGAVNNTQVRTLFSASDMLDGDLTDWINYVETNAVYNKAGDYTITMEVRNSFNDKVRYAFPLHIYARNTQDFTIALTQPLVYVEQGSSFDPMQYVAAVSDLGGNQYDPALLQVDSTVDTSIPGIYEVHYEIGGADGGATQQRNQKTDGGLRTSLPDADSYGQMWLTVIVQEVPA